MKRLSRRNALKTTGASALLSHVSTLQVPLLLKQLIANSIESAHAQSNPAPLKRIITFFMPGAWEPWHFAVPLQPSVSTNDQALLNTNNTRLSNTFLNDANQTPVYQHYVHTLPSGQQVQLPLLWGSSIPVITNETFPTTLAFRTNAEKSAAMSSARVLTQTTPMTSLYKNLWLCRGIDHMGDGHGPGAMRIERPIQGKPSISGIIADHSSTVLKSIHGFVTPDQSEAYYSSHGNALINIRTGDEQTALSKIFEPFSNVLIANRLPRREALKEMLDRTIDAIESQVKAHDKNAPQISIDRKAAEKLLVQSFEATISKWVPTVAKYYSLMRSSLGWVDSVSGSRIPGVTSHLTTIQSSGNMDSRTESSSNSNTTGGVIRPLGAEMGTIFKVDSFINMLAESFAVAEILATDEHILQNNLWQSAMLNIANLTANISAGTGDFGFIRLDEHYIGTRVSLLKNAYQFRAIAAAMYHLIEKIKEHGQFNNTIVMLTSEFGRNPRLNNISGQWLGTGSDHASFSGATMMWHGLLPTEPIITGKLYVRPNPLSSWINTAAGFSFEGTWMGAPNTINGANTRINYAHISTTLLKMMGVENIPFSEFALLSLNNGTWTPLHSDNQFDIKPTNIVGT